MSDQVKPLAFKGGAGGFFIAAIISTFLWYVLILGWPIAFNLMNGWIVENTEVNGRKLRYEAGYGETLGFLLLGILLIFITLGIYNFWFVPKIYRFVMEHTRYADTGEPVEAAASA